MNASSSPNPIFVTTLEAATVPQLMNDLEEQGFEIEKAPHTHFTAKKRGISCTFYQSGKLVVQGKEIKDFIEFYLEPMVLKKMSYSYQDILKPQVDYTPRIGIDESGKGDFFGPLCVAGVYAGAEQISKLQSLGVKDSKLLSDKDILRIGEKIKESCIHHIVKINPKKYNELIAQFKNLNHLLAWGHATTIENLVEKTGCKSIVVDQFANEQIVLTALKRKSLTLDVVQRHRAEEDIVVAAASILARQTFLEALISFQKKFGQAFPKGASKQTIAAGKLFIQNFSKEELGEVAKLHFKTLDSIIR